MKLVNIDMTKSTKELTPDANLQVANQAAVSECESFKVYESRVNPLARVPGRGNGPREILVHTGDALGVATLSTAVNLDTSHSPVYTVGLSCLSAPTGVKAAR